MLVQSIEGTDRRKNAADTFCEVYNEGVTDTRERCQAYVTEVARSVLDDFVARKFRTLVIIGRLLEGFDHPSVSVVAIARNVLPTSRVLFTQFVGRAVRKLSRDDPVTANVISHPIYAQGRNFSLFDRAAEEDADPRDEDDA